MRGDDVLIRRVSRFPPCHLSYPRHRSSFYNHSSWQRLVLSFLYSSTRLHASHNDWFFRALRAAAPSLRSTLALIQSARTHLRVKNSVRENFGLNQQII